jgi:hypothetical protein
MRLPMKSPEVSAVESTFRDPLQSESIKPPTVLKLT